MKGIDFSAIEKPYLIAEIGINHNGDIQNAKRLVDAAFACQWDCVKFQKRNPDKAVPEHQKNQPKDTPWGSMTYLEYKYRMEFGRKEYDALNRYAQTKPIAWTASVWDLDSVDFMEKYDVPFLKIPSALLTDENLLKAACRTGIPILASTGMSTLREIDRAVLVMEKYSSQFALMHCNSTYPAPPSELNFSVIPKLRKRYNCVVGYSGHEYGLAHTPLAVAFGALIIERHITLDHSMWGTDQSASIEPQGMDKLRKHLRDVLAAVGDGKKIVYPGELAARKKLRGV